MQNNQSIAVIPDGLAKGFTCFGNLQKDKPLIVTYELEAFFKIAQTDYAVALVLLPSLCHAKKTELKAFDFEQIQFVINQLSDAGYQNLYMTVRPEHIKTDAFQKLEKSTAETWEAAKTDIANAYNTAAQGVENTYSNVKTAVSGAVDNAKDAVNSGIDSVQKKLLK